MKHDSVFSKCRSVLYAMLPLCLGICVAAAIAPQNAGSQQLQVVEGRQKVFERNVHLSPYPDPFPLIEIRRGEKVVPIGMAFEAEDDWLRGTSFKLRNDSGKNIVHINAVLLFPETASSGNTMVYAVSLGHPLGVEGSQAEPLVRPEGEVTIEVDDKRYGQIREFIERRQPMSTISKVRLEITLVVFHDGTAWGGGEYRRQDPSNPRLFVPIP